MARQSDPAFWLMTACAALTLSSVTLLAPPRAAQAAPPVSSVQTTPKPALAMAYDDGDGDELLEHWGDPRYAHEERLQMGGVLGGFTVLGIIAWRKRSRRQPSPVKLTLVDLSEKRKAA